MPFPDNALKADSRVFGRSGVEMHIDCKHHWIAADTPKRKQPPLASGWLQLPAGANPAMRRKETGLQSAIWINCGNRRRIPCGKQYEHGICAGYDSPFGPPGPPGADNLSDFYGYRRCFSISTLRASCKGVDKGVERRGPIRGLRAVKVWTGS